MVRITDGDGGVVWDTNRVVAGLLAGIDTRDNRGTLQMGKVSLFFFGKGN